MLFVLLRVRRRDHLAQLFDHLLNADVSILRDFALHLREPLAQLLVLLVEHGPFVQLLADLLPAQRNLTTQTRKDTRIVEARRTEGE